MQDPVGVDRSRTSQLHGKVALITGGTKNIGRATARAFAAAGADLVVTARNEAGLEATRTELMTEFPGKVVTVPADVSSDEDIVRSVDVALEAFGGVDILVNNAYYSSRLGGLRPGLEMTIEQWDSIWRGNVLATYRYTQLLEPTMRERGSGSIINVLSIAAAGYFEGLMAYAASKNALATITRYLSVDLAPAIRVNAISPGAVSPDGKPRDSIQRDLLRLSPLQRVGSADEIASVAVFLASDASSFVTGQVIVADGGVLARSFGSG
jgi:NAD(P)-dependent dehydrogenase (short-subunit alcohol dehydrogenase family)